LAARRLDALPWFWTLGRVAVWTSGKLAERIFGRIAMDSDVWPSGNLAASLGKRRLAERTFGRPHIWPTAILP